VISGTVVFCQGGKCQAVEAGESAGDDSSDSDQSGQSNPPGMTPPAPYTPQNPDQCNTANCSSTH